MVTLKIGPRVLAASLLAGSLLISAFPHPLGGNAAQAQGANISIAVPAYFTDQALWDKVIATKEIGYVVGHPDTPAAGAGYVADKDLLARLDKAKAAGKKTFVYVTAGYDKVDWKVVADKIDSAFTAYPNVDGVFIDEINYDQCDKYKSLANGEGAVKGVKARHPGKLIVLNPGAPILNCYEGLGDGYLNLERADKDVQDWVNNVNLPNNVPFYQWMFKPERRTQIWEMVHSVPAARIKSAVDDALTRNASILFVTSDALPNPYDTLSDDASFQALVDRVNDYNSGRVALPAILRLTVPPTTTIAAPVTTAKPTSARLVPTTKAPRPKTKKRVIIKKKAAAKD